MNTLVRLIVGAVFIGCCGFTYRAGRGFSAHDIDVRVVEVGGHEYVVASSYAGSADGGVAISLLHHVGCKKCVADIKKD